MSEPPRYGAEAARRAAATIRDCIGGEPPAIALVLGSGLGGLADEIEHPRRVPYRDVPGFPPATVVGHAGVLVAGTLAHRRVLALSGRFHMYEGHDVALAAFPVRVMHALGARTLFVSNAAGGLRPTFRPGDLMLIADHVNLMFRNPLVGPLESGDERFPDMSAPYDPGLRDLARRVALDAGVRLQEGVYVGLLGPSYETPAEVRMLQLVGGDAVGMSTVPEVIVARALGMRVVGMSCITNLACGLSVEPITHAEVLEVTREAGERMKKVVRGVVGGL